MKKVLLFAVSAFLFAAPAFAQVNVLDVSPELEKKCTNMTRTMAQKLHLNEPTYIKLKALNREHMVKANEILHAYSNDENSLREKTHALELAYEQKITALLTPEQLAAYADLRKESSVARFVAATDGK